MDRRLPDAEWFLEAVEHASDAVVAFTTAGVITYINHSTERLFDVERDAILGDNITAWVHPDDLDRAFEVIGLMMDGGFRNASVTPAVYRVRRGQGGWISLEVNGAQLAPVEGVDSIVIVCRDATERVIHDEILEHLTRNEPVDGAVALVAELGRWRHPTERHVIALTDDHGARQALGATLPPELDGRIIEDDESPWSAAIRTGNEVTVAVEDLPAHLRELAEREGLVGCRVAPVSDPATDGGATITIWSTPSGPPISVHRYSLDTMKRALALVLRWRHHVRQLTEASHTDHLTGTASRSRFFALLDQASVPGADELAAVLYVDLDRFKPVNDRFGHRTGDEVLVIVAQRIASVIRPSDVLARIGGDEFAVLCRGISDISEATTIADRLIQAVAGPIRIGGHSITVDASVGIAHARTGTVDGDALLDSADRALYRAKREGRGRWSLAG